MLVCLENKVKRAKWKITISFVGWQDTAYVYWDLPVYVLSAITAWHFLRWINTRKKYTLKYQKGLKKVNDNLLYYNKFLSEIKNKIQKYVTCIA